MPVVSGPWKRPEEHERIERRLASALEGASAAIADLTETSAGIEREAKRAVDAMGAQVQGLEARVRQQDAELIRVRRGRLVAWCVAAALAAALLYRG